MLERIARSAGVPELPDVLADRIRAADLAPLLLHAYRRRSTRRSPADLMAQHERDATVAPAEVDARRLNALDRLAFAAAEQFEALELAPVCPLATNAVLGGIDQNNVLTTIRNTEVLADPTSAQALECARRRRLGEPLVRLCASHRVVRMQPFDVPGFTRHFRLFALASASRTAPFYGFEAAALREHLAVYLQLLTALRAEGYCCDDITVEVSHSRVARAVLSQSGADLDQIRSRVRAHAPTSASDLLDEQGVSRVIVSDPLPDLTRIGRRELAGPARLLASIHADVFPPLAREFPTVDFVFDLTRAEALDYYSGAMLKIIATDADGVRLVLADGGCTTWTQRLLSDRKERLMVSGIGLSLIATRFTSGDSQLAGRWSSGADACETLEE
jgi:hypothetical protein